MFASSGSSNAPWYVGDKFSGDAPTETAPRRGMFGGRNVGDLISNFLINYSAAQGSPLGLAGVQQRGQLQQQQAETKQREITRQQAQTDRWDMFQREHEYTAAHPQPPQPTELERLMALGHIDPTSPEGVAMARHAAEQTANPMTAVDVQQADGSTVRQWIRPPTGGTPPPPAVGTVEDGHRFLGGNPADPHSWAPVQGGPGQSGPATFR